MRLFFHFFVIVLLTVTTKNSLSVDIRDDDVINQIRHQLNLGKAPKKSIKFKEIIYPAGNHQNEGDISLSEETATKKEDFKFGFKSSGNDRNEDTVRYESDDSAIDNKRKDMKSKFKYLQTKGSYSDGPDKRSSKLPSFILDPVLNYLRRTPHPSRREAQQGKLKPRDKETIVKRKRDLDSSDYISSSSSLEMEDWKDEWRQIWLGKKIQALNMTTPKGDFVNMAAARPWGVPCGDPNQHDMPWGTCMLNQECDAEYRIYRGDITCGRTAFVCCALQLSTYDMYQGFDASLASTSLETDSAEKRSREEDSREKRNKKKKRDKRRRRRNRKKRKRRIKRLLRKIIRKVRKILNRSYKNGTSQRKTKTKVLKKFIKDLKKRYKNDRHSVKQIHETEITKIDIALQNRLNQILGMNQEFAKNSTFRDIIVNGTITPKVASMLMEAYPELTSLLRDNARRSGGHGGGGEYLDYDIEYGLLYT